MFENYEKKLGKDALTSSSNVKIYIIWSTLEYYKISNFSTQYEVFPNICVNPIFSEICKQLTDDITIEPTNLYYSHFRNNSLSNEIRTVKEELTNDGSIQNNNSYNRNSDVLMPMESQTPVTGKINNNNYKSNEVLFSSNNDNSNTITINSITTNPDKEKSSYDNINNDFSNKKNKNTGNIEKHKGDEECDYFSDLE